jgi:hypothetical protein
MVKDTSSTIIIGFICSFTIIIAGLILVISDNKDQGNILIVIGLFLFALFYLAKSIENVEQSY